LAELDNMQQQLVAVQSQLAFQEDTMRELHEALARQQQEILLLRRQIQLLKQRLDEQVVDLEPGFVDQKPPHY
jgi:SlyX protein